MLVKKTAFRKLVAKARNWGKVHKTYLTNDWCPEYIKNS